MKRMLMAVAAALALLAPSAAAAAPDEAARARSNAARVVEIRVSGDAAALAKVRATARELLLRLDVQANIKAIDEPETPASEPTPLVIAYVDLRNSTSPSINIEDGKTKQELTRRTLSDVSSLETGAEAVLHVLYLAVESALQVGAAPRAEPEAASHKPEPAPPARRAPARHSRFGFDLGPLLRLSSLGGDRVVPGGGIALEPRADVGRGAAGLLLLGAVHGTTNLSFAGGAAELRPVQLRSLASFDWLLSPNVSGVVGLGGGLDSLFVDGVQAPQQGAMPRVNTVLDPVVSGMVGARVPISGPAFLSALASLDLDLAPASFVARQGPVTQPLLQLPRLRAGFTLALSFTALGSNRFAREHREP